MTTKIANTVIVISVDATLPEKTAADELAQYLQKMTGMKIKVIDEKNTGIKQPAIYVGHTQFSQRHGIVQQNFSIDAFQIKSVDKNLILCGSKPRGTLYAVAQYLEDYYGVRWFTAQGEELVPKHKYLVIPKIDKIFKPALVSRDLMAPYKYAHPGDTRLDRWLAFNRINGTASDMHGNTGPSQHFGGSYYPQLGLFVHNMIHVFMRADKYYDKHPEYYALGSGGTRSERGLCMTNPEMRAQFLVELRELLAKNDNRRDWLISISPADGAPYCSCPECQATDGPYGLMGYILNPAYLELVNYLARGIKTDYPNVRLEYLAYGSGAWYAPHPNPEKRFESNVVVRYAPIHKNHWDPIDSTINKPWLDYVKAWKTRTNSIRIWEYPHHHGFGVPIFRMSYSGKGNPEVIKWVKSAIKDLEIAKAGWCLAMDADTGSESKHYVNINGYGATDTYEAPTLTVVYRTNEGKTSTAEIILSKSDVAYITESGFSSFSIQSEHTCAEIKGSIDSTNAETIIPAGSKSVLLFRFDLSSIPSGASIVDASLRLQKGGNQGVLRDESFAIYVVNPGTEWNKDVFKSVSKQPLIRLPAPKGLQGFGAHEALMPQPNTFTVLRNLRVYRQNGADGIFLETNAPGLSSMHCMSDLNYWVFAKGMWDQTRSPDAIVWDFCIKYYGAAGKSVFEYLKLLHRVYDDDPVKLRLHMGNMSMQKFFALDFAVKAHTIFDLGEKSVAKNKIILDRLRRARMDLDIATLFYLNRFSVEYAEKHGGLHGFPLDRQRIAQRYSTARERLMRVYYPDKLADEQKNIDALLIAATKMPTGW